ncbi:hypothetical protein N9A28_06540 [Sulfurimonas sp.]|nr:hypothetical protein [Sulfurimonas sp.]
MRFTLDEYCKEFKMSKEMLNSKLKSKKINYIIENGETFIIVTKNSIHKQNQEKHFTVPAKPKTTVATVISLYQRENTALKEKVMQLEMKIDKLIDDKEQMLRDERDKIEELYTTKDAQLKNILELVNSKMRLESENQTIHEIESIEKQDEMIELKEYLKSLGIKSSKRKIIKNRFLDIYDTDTRISLQNGKILLNISKYDYRDLLG